VWNTLQCETFGEYHMAYLKSDVALSAEVFKNYRESCMKMFGLDQLDSVHPIDDHDQLVEILRSNHPCPQ
jgi:hypothetical protein